MSYVYRRIPFHTCADVYVIGFYSPDGVWEDESVSPTKEGAAERVHWLNGGDSPKQIVNVAINLFQYGIFDKLLGWLHDVTQDEITWSLARSCAKRFADKAEAQTFISEMEARTMGMPPDVEIRPLT